MSNHKWNAEKEWEYGSKPHVCKVCGIHKEWYGEAFQCWHYWWYEVGIAMNGSNTFSKKETFKRPDCNPEIKSKVA